MLTAFVWRTSCAAMVLLAGLSTVAIAKASPSPSPSPVPEIAHVVTSDRHSEVITSSARTTYVIGRADILRNGYMTVSDAIQSLPGISLLRYGPGAAGSWLSIRGSSPVQALVLINGMPAGGSQIADSDVAAIPTNGVERIEVVEGGGSTLYGSGSMGGIVNIITTPLRQTVVDTSAGSFGEQDIRIQTPNVSFERAVGSDDYPLPNGSSRYNADYGIWNGRVSFDRTYGNISANVSAGITDRHQGVPGPVGYYESRTSRQDDVSRDASGSFSHTLKSVTSTLKISATSQDLAYTCDTPVDPTCLNATYPLPTSPPYGPVPYASLLTESRIQMSLIIDSNHQFARTIYGTDMSRGTARVDDGIDAPQVHGFAESAAYLQQTWNDRRADLAYAGLRAERDGWQGGAYSPSAGGILHLFDGLSLRANTATAFRAPTVEDLYYPNFSNPNLAPERVWVGDCTLDDVASFGDLALTWFTMDGNNMIVSNPPAYQPENVQHAAVQGLTLSLRSSKKHHLYYRLDTTDLYKALDLQNEVRLIGSGPVLQLNEEVGYVGSRSGAIDSAAITIQTAGISGFVDSSQPHWLEPVAHTTIGAFVRMHIMDDSLITVRGTNLGNERYAQVPGYPLPGRAVAVELSHSTQ